MIAATVSVSTAMEAFTWWVAGVVLVIVLALAVMAGIGLAGDEGDRPGDDDQWKTLGKVRPEGEPGPRPGGDRDGQGEEELRARPGDDGQWAKFPTARTPGVAEEVPGGE